MGERYWLWVGARLLVGVVIVAWAASYLNKTGSGEKEFQKTLAAMKQVHSFRATFLGTPGTQHNEMLWEVDCNRDLLHYHWHVVGHDTDPPAELDQDQVHAGYRQYDRQKDGNWVPAKYASGPGATGICNNLKQGIDTNIFPAIATMIQRGIIQKGDKKTVNGVRCREWLVTLKGGMSSLEHDTVCLGLDDHLPYETTVDWAHSRSTYSDYNAALQIDAPEAAIQPASADGGSN
jgi:hypothetical protein